MNDWITVWDLGFLRWKRHESGVGRGLVFRLGRFIVKVGTTYK